MNKKLAVIFLIASLAVSSFMVLGLIVPKAKAQDMSDIKILSYTTYVAPADSYTANAGDFIVVGEVQNQGTAVWDLPEITAVAYTTDGVAVASAGNTAFVKDLLPQQKAPFYIDFTPDATDPNGNYSGTLDWEPLFDHVTLTVWAQPTNDSMYRGLTLAGSTSYTVSGTYSVTGYIQNTGGNLTGDVWAVTTFYNASGGVVACNYTDFLDLETHALAVNQSVPFTATPIDNTAALSNSIASYSVLIQTKAYDPTELATPTPTAAPETPTPSAVASATVQPTPPPSSQESSLSSTTIYAIVGAVVIVAAIAVMLVIRKRRT